MTGMLTGKVVLITGGGRGIGAAAARVFVEEGAKVAIADRNFASAEKLAADLRDAGGEALSIACDVTSAADCATAVERTVAGFGSLNAAFNNAGIVRHGFLTADTSEEDWNAVIAVNLTGVFLAMKHEIPAMLSAGGGAIVNTSSVGGASGAAMLA